MSPGQARGRQDAAHTQGTDQPPSGDVGAMVSGRLRSIDHNDPDRHKKAVRIYLEAVLMDRLGANVASDPEFGQMISAVQAQMEADPALALDAQALAEDLLRGVLPR